MMWRIPARLLVLAGAWLVAGAGVAGARQLVQNPCPPEIWAELGWTSVDDLYPGCFPDTSFRLRGSADFAGAGLRPTNPTVSYFITNSGPGDSEMELRRQVAPFYIFGPPAHRTSWNLSNWRIQWMAASSRSDWLRNRELVPELRNVRGGGFNAAHNLDALGGAVKWSGADGSVGNLHSGVQAGPEGCLDPGAPSYPHGFPLLALSDCPETWGTAEWMGRRWIGPIENWINYFQEVGGANFVFDPWRVPEEFWQEGERPLTVGDNVQTFGVGSDWGAEVRRMYGNAIPGQTGDPIWEGYPIGLSIHFNAFSFKVPAVSNGYINEARIVNDSEAVYGVPLDYDSLWFGWQYGPFRTHATPIPELGVIVHTNTGVDEITDCREYLRTTGTGNCTAWTSSSRGFRVGGHAIMVLNSPLGDLRNKHFSDPSSPFFAPGHPLAGDTITMNRFGWCHWSCTGWVHQGGIRGLYGMTVADPIAALAGREPISMTRAERQGLFQQVWAPDGMTEIFCNTAQPRDPGCFGYVVPGTDNYISSLTQQPSPVWTYTNRPPGAPGGPDTLWIDICRPPTSDHPARNQCPGLFSDSVSDGTLNNANAGFWYGAGPFPLKAGDTVPFTVAVFTGTEPEQWYTIEDGRMLPGPIINDWYNFYMNDFYLGPSQPPPPSIISVATEGGSSLFGGPRITLFLDDATESWRDRFTMRFIEELRNPPPGSFAEQIKAADPGAADRLLELVDRNIVDTVYIFKSCDLGRSVTRTGALRCDPAPLHAITGARLRGGWQAYSWLVPDDHGRFPKQWVDNNVAGGRRYVYSMVAVTSGVELETQYVPLTGGAPVDTTITIITPGETAFTLRAGNPWVTEVYVPLMPQAGAQPARAELIREEGPLRWERQVDITFFPNADRSGNFRLVFGRDAAVREYREPGAEALVRTEVVLARDVLALMPDGSLERLELPFRRYNNHSPHGIAHAGDDQLIQRDVQQDGGLTVTITRMNRKTGLLLDADTDEVLFASGRIEPDAFTPGDFAAHPGFRQFTLDIEDADEGYEPGPTGSFIGQSWRYQGEPIRGIAWPSVEHLRGAGQLETTQLRYGTWEFSFGAPFFGSEAERPAYDVNDPRRTADAYTALLERRPEVSRTSVSDAVVQAIRLAVDPNITADDLIEVKLPFVVRNVDHGDRAAGGAPVTVAMLRSNKVSTALLGLTPDTVTADVPPDVWIPGESLILLEEVALARTNPDGSLRVLADGEPEWTSELRVTATRFLLGCAAPQLRITCNPLTGPRGAGAPGYVDVRPQGDPTWPEGWRLAAAYRDVITSQSMFEFRVLPELVGESVQRVTQSMLDQVRVVPNPYLGLSAFEYVGDTRRIMWTSLPPSGSIHIFTASGQYVQRLDWTPDDLQGVRRTQTGEVAEVRFAGSGDLAWDLNTKEGTEVASGVYVYVLETNDPETGRRLTRTGKFIIIK